LEKIFSVAESIVSVVNLLANVANWAHSVAKERMSEKVAIVSVPETVHAQHRGGPLSRLRDRPCLWGMRALCSLRRVPKPQIDLAEN
jgi:hypothetical protein